MYYYCHLGPTPHLLIEKICLDNGDVMNAATLVTVGDDRRDATFVHAHYCKIKSLPLQY